MYSVEFTKVHAINKGGIVKFSHLSRAGVTQNHTSRRLDALK